MTPPSEHGASSSATLKASTGASAPHSRGWFVTCTGGGDRLLKLRHLSTRETEGHTTTSLKPAENPLIDCSSKTFWDLRMKRATGLLEFEPFPSDGNHFTASQNLGAAGGKA